MESYLSGTTVDVYITLQNQYTLIHYITSTPYSLLNQQITIYKTNIGEDFVVSNIETKQIYVPWSTFLMTACSSASKQNIKFKIKNKSRPIPRLPVSPTGSLPHHDGMSVPPPVFGVPMWTSSGEPMT